MDPRAAEYERRYPDTGIGEAQAIERMERMAFKELREPGKPVARSRYFSVPELPWQKEKR